MIIKREIYVSFFKIWSIITRNIAHVLLTAEVLISGKEGKFFLKKYTYLCTFYKFIEVTLVDEILCFMFTIL